MASTSTNKQPLLIDRVFNEAVLTDGLVSGNSNTVTGTSINYDITGSNAAKVLVNCISNDGGIVEDMYAISRGAIKKALFYLSSASDYLRAEQAVYVGSIEVTSAVGEYANVSALPRILAPVPQQGNTTGITAGIGYQHEMDNGLSIRIEATAADYDDVSASSSNRDSGESVAKKVEFSDMMSARGTISIVKSF